MAKTDLATRSNSPNTVAVNDSPSIVRLPIPGPVFLVKPGAGSSEAVICPFDLGNATLHSNPVAPTWSNVDLVLEAYGLVPLRLRAEALVREVFGAGASLLPLIEHNPDNGSRELVFLIAIDKTARANRPTFMSAYAKVSDVPSGAPVPVVAWTYSDAV